MTTLRAGELEAAFLPDAGMVGASLRHRGDELLGQRRGLDEYRSAGSTFGVPLLHPWANRLAADAFVVPGTTGRVDLAGAGARVHRDEHGRPNHGLLAAEPTWQVVERDEAALTATLDVAALPAVLAAFPFPHALTVAVALDPRGVTVTTTLGATDDVAVPVAFGWHPYLTLPGVPRAQWRLTLPARRHLLTAADGLPTGATAPAPAEADAPLGERTFDDGYDQLAARPPAFTVTGGGRRLGVAFLDGYPAAQVFAPPGQPLIAFEPMTAPTNALVSGDGLRLVSPGETFTATFRIDVADD